MSLAPSPFAVAADLLWTDDDDYAEDPVGYVRDVMGEHLWSKQAEMVAAPVKHRKVVVKAAHSVGKTRGLSRLVISWVLTHPIGEALVVITSDNDDNIKGGIWQEVIAAHERAAAEGRPFPGKVTLDGKWHAGPNNQTLVAFGRKPSDRNPTGLHGFHRKNLLVIIDECAGVPEELWEAANSLASNARGRVIAVGNPTDPNSHFAEVCKPGSGWEVQKISAYDTPAYTGEPCPDDVLENLVDPSWVEDMKLKGVKDPRYVARVLGEFPKVSSDSLIEAEWIEAAQKRSLPRTRKPHLGIDIARFGDDESVIMQREGGWVRAAWVGGKLSTMVTTGHIVRIKNKLNAEPGLNDFVTMAVDADGLGAGVYDRLVELGHSVGEIRGGLPAIKPEDFVNRRSEWYWNNLRKRFEDGEIDIDPLDKALAQQLVKIKWSMTSKGQIAVETKKEMRARGLPSPDRADAVAYAFAHVDLPTVDVEAHQGESITGDLMQKAW